MLPVTIQYSCLIISLISTEAAFTSVSIKDPTYSNNRAGLTAARGM